MTAKGDVFPKYREVVVKEIEVLQETPETHSSVTVM
jgi:hypothetical protein